MYRGFWLVVAALVASSGAAVAQDTDEPLRPEISFPDVEHGERVVPLDDAGEMTLNATITCQKTPLPLFWTEVGLNPKGPSFANPIVSPGSQVFSHDPVECGQGTPLEVEAMLSVALTQNAPAFETIDLPVEMTVQRSGEGPVPAGTYTEEANATFTVGYYSLVNVRAEEKVATTAPGGSHTYEISVDNFSNGPTDVAPSIAKAPEGVDVEVSEPVVLGSNESATLDVVIEDTAKQPDAAHRVEIDVDATSTDPRAKQSSHAEVRLLLGVDGRDENLATQAQEATTPGPGLGLALTALAGLAAVLASRPRRP